MRADHAYAAIDYSLLAERVRDALSATSSLLFFSPLLVILITTDSTRTRYEDFNE